MLRFNNGAAANLFKFYMECSYAIQDFALYKEQVNFANDVCPSLLNPLVALLCGGD